MKRIIALSLVCVLAIAAFCSCGQSAKKLSEVFTEIKSEVTLKDFDEFKSADDLNRFYGISADDVEEYAGGVNNTGVNQEEIVLVKAKDDSAASKVKDALDNRYKAKLNENKNYNPEQAKIIEKCKVESDGVYVSMIVSENADKITEIFKKGIG